MAPSEIALSFVMRTVVLNANVAVGRWVVKETPVDATEESRFSI
jgi:hypothetical protein